MPKVTLPIDGGFYESDALEISSQSVINWYVNVPQTQGLTQANLFGTPGLLQLATTGDIKQVNRGSHVSASIPYFVNGITLYRLDRTVDGDGVETFTTVALGNIPGEGRVSIADNGKQLMVLVPGGDGFIWTQDALTFETITDGDFKANGDPQLVVFIDGFFLVTTDSKKFIISALNDGTNWNALDFASAESDPDIIIAPLVFKNQVFIAGTETVEAFQNLPQGADFPFKRSGLFLDKGVFAPFSIINTPDSFMFIGGGTDESPAIWQFTGSGVKKVSTTAIDNILQDLTETQLNEIFAYTYAQKGAYFASFSLPNTTLSINTITGKWNETKSEVINAEKGGITETLRSRINSLVTAFGRVLVGDSQDGRIGHLDPNTFTEYGSEIIRSFVTAPFSDKGDPVFVASLEVTMQSGSGNETVIEPKIRLAQSRDARRFQDERIRSFGKIGEFTKRAIWRRLGRSPRYVLWKFTFSDAANPAFIKLEADIRIGKAA